jgi:ABC-type transporter Mla subunit MlaD
MAMPGRRPAPSPRASGTRINAAVTAAPPEADRLDDTVRSLAASHGEAQVKDLVATAGTSLGGLLSLIQTLQSFVW